MLLLSENAKIIDPTRWLFGLMYISVNTYYNLYDVYKFGLITPFSSSDYL